MQRFDLNWRRSEIGSSSVEQQAFSSAPCQQLLEEIGGEPLAGCGFEDEEPEFDFASAEEES